MPVAPGGLVATTASASQINLSWTNAVGATGYNVKRSATVNGTYTIIATNLTSLFYADTGLASVTTYYYVGSATNIYGESANSIKASAQTVSTAALPLSFTTGNGLIQFAWPLDHLGWHLQMQTNPPDTGLGTNWLVVPNSNLTNQFSVPIDPANGNVFFRLTYP